MPRPALLPLLAGLAAAGAGLASLGAVLAPPPPPAPFAWPDPAAAPATAQAPAPRPAAATPWPDIFGTFAPQPEAEPEPEAEPDAPEWIDLDLPPEAFEPDDLDILPPDLPPPHDLRLRGLAMDDAGGWALIETPEGEALIRPGAEVAGGHRLVAVGPEGAIFDSPEGTWILSFDPEDGSSPAPASPPHSPALLGRLRGLVPDRPPPGYHQGFGPGPGNLR